MTKNQFRILVVTVLAVTLFGMLVDLLWPNEITKQITAYAEQLEPEWSDTKLALSIVWAFVAIVCWVGSVIGLLLFKNWGRLFLLLGFIIIIPIYIPMGTTVYSPLSQIFYDLGSYGEGAILALCYFSPIAKYFEKKI